MNAIMNNDGDIANFPVTEPGSGIHTFNFSIS
jgi:hypothetical protein